MGLMWLLFARLEILFCNLLLEGIELKQTAYVLNRAPEGGSCLLPAQKTQEKMMPGLDPLNWTTSRGATARDPRAFQAVRNAV